MDKPSHLAYRSRGTAIASSRQSARHTSSLLRMGGRKGVGCVEAGHQARRRHTGSRPLPLSEHLVRQKCEAEYDHHLLPGYNPPPPLPLRYPLAPRWRPREKKKKTDQKKVPH